MTSGSTPALLVCYLMVIASTRLVLSSREAEHDAACDKAGQLIRLPTPSTPRI